MKIVRLLSVERFRELQVINEDTSADIIKKVLYQAQSIKVLQFLGSKLYNKILELVDTDEIEDAENVKYKQLLDEHIHTVLGGWGYHKIIPHLTYQLTDKGLQQRDGNHSRTPADNTVTKQLKIAENDAEFVTSLMITFICEHQSDYPEYGQTDDGIEANKKPYFSGIQFGHGSGGGNSLENP